MNFIDCPLVHTDNDIKVKRTQHHQISEKIEPNQANMNHSKKNILDNRKPYRSRYLKWYMNLAWLKSYSYCVRYNNKIMVSSRIEHNLKSMIINHEGTFDNSFSKSRNSREHLTSFMSLNSWYISWLILVQ